MITRIRGQEKVLINGSWIVPSSELEERLPSNYIAVQFNDKIIPVEVKEYVKINKIIGHFKKNVRVYTTALVMMAAMLDGGIGSIAFAKTSGGIRLLTLIQKGAFWISTFVAIWGIIEAQLDMPGWKSRITRAIIGYVAIIFIPVVFLEIEHALRADALVEMWGQ